MRSLRLIKFALILAIFLLLCASNLLAQDTSELPTDTPMPPRDTATDVPTDTLTPTYTDTAIPTDTPTDTIVPTETPIPTDTPTIEPTATPTLEPLATETLEPTAALSETPTLEASASPTLATETSVPSETPTATLTATPLPPEPPMSLLFSDSFDSGPLPIWTFGTGWTVVPSEGGQALQVTNSDEPTTLVYDNLFDLAAQARFQINAGAAKLTLRQSIAGDYSATLDASGQVSLLRVGTVIGSATVSPSTPGQWRTLRLSVVEGVLRVAVDGIEVIALLDAAPLPPGQMAFVGVGIGENVILVDDVEVWLPSTSNPVSITIDEGENPQPLMLNVGAVIQSQLLTFVQDFQGNPPNSGEAIAPYTISGTPNAFVGTCASNSPYPAPSACARFDGPSGTNTPVEIDVTLQLGNDPNSTYRVTRFVSDLSYQASPSSSLLSQHIVETILKDRNGNPLYHSTCTLDTALQSCTSIVRDPTLPYTAFPVDGVRTVTRIHRTNGNINAGATTYYWLLWDNFRVDTDQVTVDPPSPTPTVTPTSTPDNCVGGSCLAYDYPLPDKNEWNSPNACQTVLSSDSDAIANQKREGCANVVYNAFFDNFSNPAVNPNYISGTAPHIRDLLAAVYSGELSDLGDSSLARETFANNYWAYVYSNCSGYVCSKQELVGWLIAVQSWFQKGNIDGSVSADNLYLLFYNPGTEQAVTSALSPSPAVRGCGDDRPCQWGDYKLSSSQYTEVRAGTNTLVALCVIDQYWRDGNPRASTPIPPNNVADLAGGDFWTDYVFVLAGGSIGQTSTYSPSSDPRPGWLDIEAQRNLRRGVYKHPTCPGTDDTLQP